MNAAQDKFKNFEHIFFPKSIAVVGASAHEHKLGNGFLGALVHAGYKGKLYAVNPAGGNIFGLDVYPSVQAIPGPVEYVIVVIPRQGVLKLLDDCAEKGVKAVQFFTAGFSECGEEKWKQVEQEMVKKARAGGFRIVGPNCVGVYSPANIQPLGFIDKVGEVGPVAFVAQSGGHAERFLEYGLSRGIGFSKAVSFGNGSDLDSSDYFEYLASDPQTQILASYLEGVKDGRRLFQLIKEINKTKPAVIWKGGRTKAGAQAAASHTASLAASDAVWTGALRQAGAIKVESLEEMGDTVQILHHLGKFRGNRVCILAGLTGGGGGESVSATDACVGTGLEVPPFDEDTRTRLSAIVRQEGTIQRNPLDIGGLGSNLDILGNTLQLLDSTTNMDLLILNINVGSILRMSPPGRLWEMMSLFVEFKRNSKKPLVVVSYPGLSEANRLEVEDFLAKASVPVFPTIDRAARALMNTLGYWEFRDRLEQDGGRPCIDKETHVRSADN